MGAEKGVLGTASLWSLKPTCTFSGLAEHAPSLSNHPSLSPPRSLSPPHSPHPTEKPKKLSYFPAGSFPNPFIISSFTGITRACCPQLQFPE